MGFLDLALMRMVNYSLWSLTETIGHKHLRRNHLFRALLHSGNYFENVLSTGQRKQLWLDCRNHT